MTHLTAVTYRALAFRVCALNFADSRISVQRIANSIPVRPPRALSSLIFNIGTWTDAPTHAEERGWATNVDAFYTSPRPILRASSISAEYHAAAHYARMFHVLAVRMGWALQLPGLVTISGAEPDGQEWTFTRDWTRFFSVDAAVVSTGLGLTSLL